MLDKARGERERGRGREEGRGEEGKERGRRYKQAEGNVPKQDAN